MTPGAPSGRIGILGGTLDPLHVGHIETARAAQQALDLETVIVMPTRVPPHRQDGRPPRRFTASPWLPSQWEPWTGFRVSDEELSLGWPLVHRADAGAALGARPAPIADFLRDRGRRVRGNRNVVQVPGVLDLAHFVVVSRPGVPVATLPDRLPHLAGRMRTVESRPETTAEPSVFLVDARTPDVSSTEIRRRLRAGDSITGLVPRTVEAHILRHGLYTDTPTLGQVHGRGK